MRLRLALVPSLGLALLLTAPAAAQDASPGGGGWTRFPLTVAGRTLAVAKPPGAGRGEVLTVVIEGDGDAHDRRGRPRTDPTPRGDTAAWKIAKAWPRDAGPVIWLGRPCQHVRDPLCAPADWTTHRFSEAAVAATDAAIDAMKLQAGARGVRLVGWSGGGTIAALVTARRSDVVGLVTVAAPLDLAAWTRWHGISPLTDGLDPGGLPPLAMPQLHLLGAFDPVVPPKLGEAAARRLAGEGGRVEVRNARHACCWTGLTGEMAAVGR